MTQRENLLRLFRRQGVAFAPCQFSLCPTLETTYKERVRSPQSYEDHFQFPWRAVTGPRLLSTAPNWAGFYHEPLATGVTFDKWGVAHEPGSADAKHMTRMRHPMKDFDSLEQIQSYPYPDFARADYSHLPAQVQAIHARGLAAQFTMGDMIWEIAWYLRDMQALMLDMMTQDEKAIFLLDKVTELACIRAREFARAGLDVLHTGDDVGMQQSMMMAPEFWREWLKPRFARVIQAAKAAQPDLVFSYHSCGFVEPIINDLIEIGVDVLNPVQPECMRFTDIHARYGDRLSFWGTIGTQRLMPFGKPAEVRAEVLKNLALAGPRGGLLCAPTHLVEPEVPWENIEAYASACQAWRP